MFSILKDYLLGSTSLTENEVETIAAYFKPLKAARKENLIDFGQVCQSFYFINKGGLRIYTINKDGVETSRFFAFEGIFCTALPSFIDQKPAFEYLQAIEKSVLLVISRTDFYTLVHKFPQFERIYREILEFGFITSQKRIYGFQGFDALEKVRWVIKNQPQILQRVSNKMAASYLGISPATLSRVKSKL